METPRPMGKIVRATIMHFSTDSVSIGSVSYLILARQDSASFPFVNPLWQSFGLGYNGSTGKGQILACWKGLHHHLSLWNYNHIIQQIDSHPFHAWKNQTV